MSTTTFGDIDEEAKTAEDTPAKNEVASPATTTALGAHDDDTASAEDINIDHIQIMSKSSHFEADGASVGDICVNKEFSLVPVGEAVRGVIVATRKYWKENVPYDDDALPRFANTLAEKAEIESTTEYDGTVPVCDVTLLLERPESFTDDEAASSAFIYEFGGKEYALVKYTVQKAQAVRENHGTINTVVKARRTAGKDAGDYYFELTSKEKGAGTKYKWHQFVLRGTTNLAPEDAVAFAKSLRGE